ncbi:hypothetical protein BABINDRAFT_39836 [Babjeviella inositovora NRRL Y-12698]|uniref:Peroxidase n=1 Tax=Babjeviella inositovora NRRL Y-12698 TaxID=984486 RepID=A0A1E3QKY1_9ASCO|nr:uncharacterized protein BABINDRAFT_39836 [Babjeviella inositovora NRRL Y-12698]ODQ78310.1 hypothetical protein BABINDRAFT_39836 [Babjeviella inositovora NRRL Y-12698]
MNKQDTPNYEYARQEITKVFPLPGLDDGSLAPVILRLAWHCCGTFDKYTNTGGSNGATMRFPPELTDSGNIGLDVARLALESTKCALKWISYSDLWTLAGVVAIEYMGGPRVPWKPGRIDYVNDKRVPPNGRLPLGYKDSVHIREVFLRLDMNDQETVALLGAHAVGRCHKRYSGWEGAWTLEPTVFDNTFFKVLLNETWSVGTVPETGRTQYFNADKSLMMLYTDMELVKDPQFLRWVKVYAQDQTLFFKDFSDAFAKLLELGIERDLMGGVIGK